MAIWGLSEVIKMMKYLVCGYQQVLTDLDARVGTSHRAWKRCKQSVIKFFRVQIWVPRPQKRGSSVRKWVRCIFGRGFLQKWK